MKSNATITMGQLVEERYAHEWYILANGNSYPGYPKISMSGSVTNTLTERRELAAAVQGTGDRRVPTPQSYTVQYRSAYTGTTEHVAQMSGNAGYFNRTIKRGSTGEVIFPESASITSAIADNKAISKLGTAQRGDLDVSVDIAESSQTKAMLKRAGQLESYIEDFNDKHKGIANKYLEFTFGWKPLVQSLFGVVEEIAHVAPSLQQMKAKAADKASSSVKTVTHEFTTVVTTTSSQRVQYGFTFVPTPRVANQIARYASLNPASIAWELMPYSFLVDYLVDVGGYLRNVENALLYADGYCAGFKTVTARTTAVGVKTGNGKSRFSGDTAVFGVLKGTSYNQTKIRTLQTTWPFPARPTFRVNLGSARLLNVAALLAQLLPSPVRRVVANKRSPVSRRVLTNRQRKKEVQKSQTNS